MLATQIVIATVLALFGAGLGLFVLDAWRIVRRIRRDKTSKVSELAPGPAELVGELRATDPVIALDGSRAVVAQRTLHCKFKKKDDDAYQHASISHTECSRVEVSDESGACSIELDQMLILGQERHYVFKAKRFRELYPKLWSELVPLEAGETVEEVIAYEIAVPDGARGFLSGEVTLDDSPERGAYRDGKRRFKLRGGPRRPLIVSSSDEKAVIGMFLRPMIRVAWISLLCWLVAALAIAIPLSLTARAGF